MKLCYFCRYNLNTQIIYFQFKDFHVPFMTLQSIGFKLFAKIMRGGCVFCCSSCISFNPTSHLNFSKHYLFSNTSWRRLQCNNFSTSKTCLEEVFQRRLQDVFKKMSCNYVLKTSSRRFWKTKNVTLKTSSRRLQYIFAKLNVNWDCLISFITIWHGT